MLLRQAEDLTSKYIQTVKLQMSHSKVGDFSSQGLDGSPTPYIRGTYKPSEEDLMQSAEELVEDAKGRHNDAMQLYQRIKDGSPLKEAPSFSNPEEF